MLTFVIRRILLMIPTLIFISVISFIIIQLPPGDWVTNYAVQLRSQGSAASVEALQALRDRYGLGQPAYVQYLLWVSGFPKGDFGIAMSFHDTPVADLIVPRLVMSLALSLSTLFVVLGLAIPFGIQAAVHKNSLFDYVLSFIAFTSLSIPHFVTALAILFVSVFYFDVETLGGLYSPQYIGEPWTWDKFVDFLKHLPAPMLAIGLGGLAGTMRIMRGNLLDVLSQQYIETARAKGLREWVVVYKHAARIAVNPIISRIGIHLPEIIGGEVIVSVILSLPTLGPLFLRAIIAQDMYLAGTVLILFGVILLIGNLLADILLAWSDPRIIYR
jgi:peptide/nickel transport system permease protein